MRDYLARQVEEKRQREDIEKQFADEQAVMWAIDAKNYANEERNLNSKVNRINKENADFLHKQIDEKDEAKKNRMNMNEFLLNRQLLQNVKHHEKVSAHGSRHSNSQYAE